MKKPQNHKTAILWFRRDLRLADNPSLLRAVQEGYQIIPLYIYEEPSSLGGANKVGLHHALASLDASLKKLNSKLILRRGNAEKVLLEISQETKADAVFWNRLYEPHQMLRKTMEKAGLTVESFKASLLYEPWEVRNKQSKPYQVYTAFWNEYRRKGLEAKPLSAPKEMRGYQGKIKSVPLKDLELLPKIEWHRTIENSWAMSEDAAGRALKQFAAGAMADYDQDRDCPDVRGTSRLSPYLHLGLLSPRQVMAKISNRPQAVPYMRQIVWREFAHHLLFHFPDTVSKPLRENFKAFPWKKNKAQLRAWQKGQTGYPIVDAGMRELWTTGWMHNRVRMIAASFLVKDLMISWQDGAEWFWDTLIDADLANNTMGWQWVAGCGADASPFFRIFNPVTQGEKFDSEGAYVKKWVPELKSLDTKWIHKPWLAPESALKEAGVKLGREYPQPMVDHEWARRRALEGYEKVKQYAKA